MIKVIRRDFADLTQDEHQTILEINNGFGGLIFHEPEFNSIVQQIFQTELTYWLAYSTNEQIIGFCPTHSMMKGKLKYSYSSPTHLAVPFGGWVFDSSMVSHDELIKSMKYAWNEIGIYFSSIQFPSDTFVQTQLSVKRLATPIIDLSQTEEVIWSNSLKSSRRNRVRKAQNEGVIIKRYGAEGVNLLLPCIKDLHKKINMHDKPDDYYRKILDFYAPKNQACIFIAEKDGEVLSGCLVIGNQRYMHGWEAGIREDAPSIGLYEIMYWDNIVWSKESGSAFMDFCVIDEEKLPQIAFFKLEFTSHVVPYYSYITSKPSFRMIAKLQNYLTNRSRNRS